MALENIYYDLGQSYNHNNWPKKGSIEASHRIWGGNWIRVQIHSQPLKRPFLLERSLVFGAAALLWVISASENANSSSTETGRSRVWIRPLQHISLRGGSFGFKPLPPTGHYFQPLKCFLSLDTFGKFWKIPQEGDWARRTPFLMPFRKHSTKCLPSKTAQPWNPTLKAGEPLPTE